MCTFDDLNDELSDHLFEGKEGFEIQHPLVHFTLCIPSQVDHYNKAFEKKLAELGDAIKRKDWADYVFAHIRPYRLPALEEVANDVTDAEYWELLAHVWTDSENIWQHQDQWRELWNSSRPNKHNAMNMEEQAKLSELPERLLIYRGGDSGRCQTGLSWTLDCNKAIWFAKRLSSKPVLLTAMADRSSAHALFLRRGEKEVVINNYKIIENADLQL